MFIYSRIVLLMIWQHWKIFTRPIGLLPTFITSSWPFYQNVVRILKTKCCDTEHDKTSRQDKNINHIKVLITAGPLMLQNLFSTVKVVQIEIFNPDVFFPRCFYPVISIICSEKREVSLIFRWKKPELFIWKGKISPSQNLCSRWNITIQNKCKMFSSSWNIEKYVCFLQLQPSVIFILFILYRPAGRW